MVTIRPLDPSDETELRGYYDVCVASTHVERPGFRHSPFPEWAAEARRPAIFGRKTDLVALAEDGTVVGAVWIWMSVDDNMHSAFYGIDVHPDHRRRGIGTALVAAAEAAIPAERTELSGSTHLGVCEPLEHPQVRFAADRGYSVSSVVVLRSLPLPVPDAVLDRLDTRERAEAGGYRVETWVDGVPEEYVPSLCEVKGRIDVDAPTGDLDREPTVLTLEQYAEGVRRRVADGRRGIEAVAVKDGRVVGYSELECPSVPERHVLQVGTLVLAEHRGHGLGMACKVAALRAAQELGEWPCVRTDNEETNRWMIAINEDLGFELDGYEVVVTKRR